MRAIVQERYGELDTLRLAEVPRPDAGPGQVLVRVRAASVHADCWHAVRGRPAVLRLMGAGLWRPTCPTPGIDVAGVVEAVGDGVERWSVGDAVYGEIAGGFQWKNAGAWAEHAAVAAEALEPKPEHLSFEEAAAAPTSAALAVQNVRDEGGVEAGQAVLVNGAAGAVGTFVVQIARHLGARVTAVDRAAKLDHLRALGAERVIDFEAEPVAASGDRWDVVVDVASTLSVAEWRGILAPDGTYVFVGHDDFGRRGRRWLGSITPFLGLAVRGLWLGKNLPDFSGGRPFREKFAEAAGLLADGAIRSVVDRTFPLEQAADALRYIETGQARGQVVLTA